MLRNDTGACGRDNIHVHRTAFNVRTRFRPRTFVIHSATLGFSFPLNLSSKTLYLLQYTSSSR